MAKKLRVCGAPGCPELTTGARCPRHALPGYGTEHRRNSAHLLGAARCAICGGPFTAADPMERDHIVPLAAGGDHRPSNYQATHRSCNRSKGDR
jgi:5-methylcytosine-specific restriction endonuclease McrA